MFNEACGYCFINNVAVAAKHAVDEHALDRYGFKTLLLDKLAISIFNSKTTCIINMFEIYMFLILYMYHFYFERIR